MTYTIYISLWYNNRAKTRPPAVPEAPELGSSPHARDVMEHYGISYAEARSSPITDSWVFNGCDSHPEIIPRWMTVQEEK